MLQREGHVHVSNILKFAGQSNTVPNTRRWKMKSTKRLSFPYNGKEMSSNKKKNNAMDQTTVYSNEIHQMGQVV